MQDITIREWVEQNADEARAAIMAIEGSLEKYSDETLRTAQYAMRMLVRASQREQCTKAADKAFSWERQ